MPQRLPLLSFTLLVAVGMLTRISAQDEADPDPNAIEELVADLGSEDFNQREAAMVAIRKIGDLTVPFLRRRAASDDLEMRRRVADLLDDIETKGQAICCTGHALGVVNLAILPDDRRVLSVGEDTSIRLWDLTNGKQLQRFDGHTKQAWCLAIAPDGKSFVSGGQDRTVRLWNVEGEPTSRSLATLPDGVRSLLFMSRNARILAGALDGNIYLIDSGSGKNIATWTGHKGGVMCLAGSPDGRTILSGGGYNDDSICVRDAKTGEIRKRLLGHREHVCAVAFIDNQHAVSAGYDRIIRLWNLQTGKIEREFIGHAQTVYGLAVSRDGKRMLSGGNDKQIRLWDLATGDEARRFRQHEDGVNAVAFTANGRYAVSASNDKTVRMWYLPRVLKKAAK